MAVENKRYVTHDEFRQFADSTRDALSGIVTEVRNLRVEMRADLATAENKNRIPIQFWTGAGAVVISVAGLCWGLVNSTVGSADEASKTRDAYLSERIDRVASEPDRNSERIFDIAMRLTAIEAQGKNPVERR